MLLTEEIRCERCNRRLDAPDAEHPCRTLEEQLERLKGLARENRPQEADPKACFAMSGRQEAPVAPVRRDLE